MCIFLKGVTKRNNLIKSYCSTKLPCTTMTGRGKKAAAPKKKANGYKMPAPIPIGEVINDTIAKKKWRIGPSIGVGGFGEIYSACEHDNSPKKGSYYPFVVKIEPHENGPLFVEKHFYIRNANKDDVSTFMKSKKLSSLGMPLYFGNGSHDFKGEKYRYLVLERYGKDVWSLFVEAGRSFPTSTVFQLGLQMLDVLEYIHSRGYVHADLKGANILMGLKKGTENQAYLVDFGLANRITEKEFKPDPKCAHNGTIEYTSRDAHLGVSTMRGDLEILAYNMLQWIVGELPWEKALKQPKTVQTLKEDFMKNVKSRITKDYPNVPDALIKFFEYINSMKPKESPDFVKCQALFQNYLKKEGKSRSSKIEFTQSKKGKTKRVDNDDDADSDAPKARRGKKPKPREPESDDENNEPDSDAKENRKQNAIPKATQRRGKKPKMVIPESSDEDKHSDSDAEENEKKNDKPKLTLRKGKKPKTVIPESDAEDDQADSDAEENEKQNGNAPKGNLRKGRIPKTITIDSDDENVEPSDDETAVKNKKRKSAEPAAITRVKKIKVAPKSTPPAKENHANIATQTSIDKRRSPRIAAHVDKVDKRQVSFDSPICEIIGHTKPSRKNSANSDEDIFDDSYVIEEKKPKPKKKLLSDEEITIKRVVRKKTTVVKPVKGKSWKDCPTILNGRSAVPE